MMSIEQWVRIPSWTSLYDGIVSQGFSTRSTPYDICGTVACTDTLGFQRPLFLVFFPFQDHCFKTKDFPLANPGDSYFTVLVNRTFDFCVELPRCFICRLLVKFMPLLGAVQATSRHHQAPLHKFHGCTWVVLMWHVRAMNTESYKIHIKIHQALVGRFLLW